MLRLLISLSMPGMVFANENTAPGVPTTSYVQAALALGLIILLLLAIAWFARKLSGGKGFGQGGMQVIGGVALGPRERIVLVEVGDSWLVIGIVPGQIRTLHTLPKGSLSPSGTHSVDQPFAQWLKNISDKRSND